MPTVKKDIPTTNPALVGLMYAIGGLLTVVALLAGWPGVAAGWLFLLVACHLHYPTAMEEPKASELKSTDPDSAAFAKSQLEQVRDQRLADRFFNDLGMRLVLPGKAWLPLDRWVPRLSLVTGILVGVLAWLVPQEVSWCRWVNAVLAYIVVVSFAECRRVTKNRSVPYPGVSLRSVRQALKSTQSWIGLIMGAGAGAALSVVMWRTSVFGLWGRLPLLDVVFPDRHAAGLVSWLTLIVVMTVSGGFAGVFNGWKTTATRDWRLLKEGTAQWNNEWWPASGLKGPTPRLVKRTTIETEDGEVVHDFFSGARADDSLFTLAATIDPLLGNNARVCLLDSPKLDPKTGAPQPGTKASDRAEAVIWPQGDLPDLTQVRHSQNPELVELALRTAMMRATDKMEHPVLAEVVDLTAEPDVQVEVPDSDPEPEVEVEGSTEPEELQPATGGADDEPTGAALFCTWNFTYIDYRIVRQQVKDDLVRELGCEALVDHKGKTHPDIPQLPVEPDGMHRGIYIGVLDEPTVEDNVAQRVDELREEDLWSSRWASALKQDVNAPVPQLNMYASDRVGQAVVHRMPFSALRGESPRQYFGVEIEERLATEIGAPLVSVQGHWSTKDRNTLGIRHHQGFTLNWVTNASGGAAVAVPTKPEGVAQSSGNGSLWLLNALTERAFRKSRLPQPEVYAARCLNPRDRNNWVWEMKVRLQDGTTFSDLRGQAERLRSAFGTDWLRLWSQSDSSDQIAIYAGAKADQVKLRLQDEQLVVDLDLDQAWVDSGVAKQGQTPIRVADTQRLPSNPDVFVIEEQLPPGMGISDITDKDKREKLMNSFRKQFVDIKESTDGPGRFQLRCAVNDPLPWPVPFKYDFDLSDGIPMGDMIDGASMLFNSAFGPHLLALGVTGGGKSVFAQGLVTNILRSGADLAIADVAKKAADFKFCQKWTIGWATEMDQASALVQAINAEVKRRTLLNSQHGVGHIDQLPDDVRPRHLYALLDEFPRMVRLPKNKPSTKSEPNPKLEAERVRQIAHIEAIKMFQQAVEEMAGEARSAGIHLVLLAQKLTSDMLDNVPNLKNNTSRVLLGKATWGEKSSALREPTKAPDLGSAAPKGRGVAEPLEGDAVIIQSWFESSTDKLAAAITDTIGEPDGEGQLDVQSFLPEKTGGAFTEVDSDDLSDLGDLALLDEDTTSEVDLSDIEIGDVDLSSVEPPADVAPAESDDDVFGELTEVFDDTEDDQDADDSADSHGADDDDSDDDTDEVDDLDGADNNVDNNPDKDGSVEVDEPVEVVAEPVVVSSDPTVFDPFADLDDQELFPEIDPEKLPKF